MIERRKDFRYRQVFCDWHMPDFLPEIRIDYNDYFQRIKESGAQTLIFMAKSADKYYKRVQLHQRAVIRRGGL